MMALAIGILLAIGALAWVLYPLFAAPAASARTLDPTKEVTSVPPPSDALDPAEAAVLRYRTMRRSCPRCGPRPEVDPTFCSSCGDYLRGSCPSCGAAVTEPASRFCASCGASLAV